MSLRAVTLAQMLQSAGYATGIFGKWHLGDEAAYQPGRRGFDEVFIHGAGGIGQTYPGSGGDAPGNTYFNPAILHNGRFVKTKGFCTDVFFAEALRWVDAKRKEDRPFFVYLTPNAPHGPYVCPEKYARLYEGKGLPRNAVAYYGMITNIDDNVGTLLARLRDWGLERKTLVIFMTDNGHPIGKIYNAGMRGMKATPYQGGTRVPAFWRWPGTFKPGVDVSKLTAHVDVFPTLAALAGAKGLRSSPEGYSYRGVKLDGRSLLTATSSSAWPDRHLFVHVGRWARGKAADSKYAQCAVRTQRFRLVNNAELYDVQADPGETKNVIAAHPAAVAAMRAAYDRWWDEVLPALENENAVGPKVNPFKELYWRQFKKGP
jgi:arylsulfatase